MNARYPAHEPNASPLNEADTYRESVPTQPASAFSLRSPDQDRINRINRILLFGRTAEPFCPVDPVCLSKAKEIPGKVGGADQLQDTVNQLQSLLYAA